MIYLSNNKEFPLKENLHPKYQQIISDIQEKTLKGDIQPGDSLPSISEISRIHGVARETAVKAYKILKQSGLIDSIPGKGFFLISDQVNEAPRVFLVLNSFNPYMQVLYNSFSRSLAPGVRADIYFHHHNIDVFKNLIQSYSGRYSHYIIKPFIHNDVPDLLQELDRSKLLLLDRSEYMDLAQNYLCQDFCHGFEVALKKALVRLKHYQGIYFIRSNKNLHPTSSFQAFNNFLAKEKLSGGVLEQLSLADIRKHSAYLVITDDDLVSLLKFAREKSWIPGKDIGIMSYNDSPLLEFIADGVTSISVDFEKMGKIAADFVCSGTTKNRILKPKLIVRGSL